MTDQDQPDPPRHPGRQGPPPGYRQGPPPGYRQGPPPGYPYPVPVSPEDERTWATLAHVGGILLGFIAPLVLWLIYKDRSQFIAGNAKEALNFQLTIVIGIFISSLLTMVMIGVLLLPLVLLANIIFCIVGAVASNRGEAYRYPITIRMVQ